MRVRARYYLWNKESDFDTGSYDNICFDNNRIHTSGSREGFYLSRVVDSGEKGKEWSRAEIMGEWKPNTFVTAAFIASDTYISDGEDLSKYHSFCNCRDIMLTGVTGRYIRFGLRLVSDGSEFPTVSRVRIWHDKDDWLSFMPEVYQSDAESADFTARFLGIFKNVYDEMNCKITSLPFWYNISHTNRQFLEWLASWVGIDDVDIWNERQLRTLLENAADRFRGSGTPNMLLNMAELYTGVRPIILENYLTSDPAEAVRVWKSGKYKREPFGFTVIMPLGAVSSQTEHRTLIRIMHRYKPAHMRMKIVFCAPEYFSDGEPPQNPDICLDGRTTLTKRTGDDTN